MSRVGSIGNVGRFQPEERRAPISKLGAQFAEKRQEEAETNSRATRIKITQQQKDNFSAAFDAIDKNGNGLLESDEIYDALHYLGLKMTADEVDYMLAAVKHDDALGMTLDEFTEMMTQAETGFVLNGGSGGMPSLGGMLAKNMGKVMKYKSKDAEALALRNKVAHKKSKDVDALDDFLAKENAVVCARCHGKFDPADNKEGSCTYHRMAGKTDGSNVTNNNQKITYPCCNRTQIGLSPVLQEALGCCSGKHVTPQQLQKDPSLRPASALTGVSR